MSRFNSHSALLGAAVALALVDTASASSHRHQFGAITDDTAANKAALNADDGSTQMAGAPLTTAQAATDSACAPKKIARTAIQGMKATAITTIGVDDQGSASAPTTTSVAYDVRGARSTKKQHGARQAVSIAVLSAAGKTHSMARVTRAWSWSVDWGLTGTLHYDGGLLAY